MSIEVNWLNPYENRSGQWWKGQLHAHTWPTSKCAEVDVARSIELYKKAKLDFLAVSDHMAVTEFQDGAMTRIPGIEWQSPVGHHTGIYSLDEDLLRSTTENQDHQLLLNDLCRREALVVLNHPNWDIPPHYLRDDLDRIFYYDGIEIYNTLINRLTGQALATDKWDYVLSRGRRVLGFVSDDSHADGDIGTTWLGVRVPSASAEDILAAIRHGNFYGSSGVEVRDIRRTGNMIEMETDNAEEIQVIGEEGCVLERVMSDSIAYTVSGDAGAYVRLAAYGPGAAMAWSQPFFG